MALREEPAYCRYCFDDVVINCRDFSVIKSAQKKTLTPRAFDVLRYLIEHSHRVVEKSELFEQIWKEKFVTDNALTRAVTEIRHALGDSADSPRYVETIHKRGYRFIAKMNGGSRMQVIQMHEEENTTISGFAEPSVEATVSKAAKASRSPSKNHLRLGFSRRELKVALLLVSVSVVIVATYLLTNRGTAIDSLAVMPFIAERGDAEMEYLADGLGERCQQSVTTARPEGDVAKLCLALQRERSGSARGRPRIGSARGSARAARSARRRSGY